MIPCSFEQSNRVLDGPPGIECDPLSICDVVFDDGRVGILSCFKFTEEEWEEVKKTGRVWLLVSGSSMPPVSLSGKEIL